VYVEVNAQKMAGYNRVGWRGNRHPQSPASPAGTVIAYSAKPRQVAADGDGAHSPEAPGVGIGPLRPGYRPQCRTNRSNRTLTPKQARFVAEYLIDLNASQAAIRAGYSKTGARTEGSRLLANADIANHGLVVIPPGVYHGWKNIGADEATIIGMPSILYDYEAPDRWELMWDSPAAQKLIPYRWP
jgi:hypothetical protein